MITRHRRRKQNLAMPEITLTPLIDTALVLLVIFMVAAPIVHNAIKVELPKGAKNEVDAQHDDIVIYFDAQQELYINDKKVLRVDFIKTLQTLLARLSKNFVFIKADQVIPWGEIVALSDQIGALGINVYFATEKKKT